MPSLINNAKLYRTTNKPTNSSPLSAAPTRGAVHPRTPSPSTATAGHQYHDWEQCFSSRAPESECPSASGAHTVLEGFPAGEDVGHERWEGSVGQSGELVEQSLQDGAQDAGVDWVVAGEEQA
jgi:hypothetical protein